MRKRLYNFAVLLTSTTTSSSSCEVPCKYGTVPCVTMILHQSGTLEPAYRTVDLAQSYNLYYGIPCSYHSCMMLPLGRYSY